MNIYVQICNIVTNEWDILIHEFYDYHDLYKADELLKRKSMHTT